MSSQRDRVKAAEFRAMAQDEADGRRRLEYEALAQSYLDLARLAERNSQTDIVYETTPLFTKMTGPHGSGSGGERS